MRAFRLFYPREELSSVDGLSREWLEARGIKGIIFDIDGTLVPQDDPADAHAVELFARLHREGFRTVLLSNNGEERVSRFAKLVGSDYFCRAKKPSLKGYLWAAHRMQLKRPEILVAGDQLFTDILGANRAHIRSVLIRPIQTAPEPGAVRVKRVLEKLVFKTRKKAEIS